MDMICKVIFRPRVDCKNTSQKLNMCGKFVISFVKLQFRKSHSS